MAQLDGADASVAELADKLYDKTSPWLKIAARHNVLAHLLKLKAEAAVAELAPAPADEDPVLAAVVAASRAGPGSARGFGNHQAARITPFYAPSTGLETPARPGR